MLRPGSIASAWLGSTEIGNLCVQTGPMLEKVEEVVLGLTRLLDSRVFVALGRGLWDFTAKDVYDYVESLQEDRHNKVRPCCPLRLGRCPEPAPAIISIAKDVCRCFKSLQQEHM